MRSGFFSCGSPSRSPPRSMLLAAPPFLHLPRPGGYRSSYFCILFFIFRVLLRVRRLECLAPWFYILRFPSAVSYLPILPSSWSLQLPHGLSTAYCGSFGYTVPRFSFRASAPFPPSLPLSSILPCLGDLTLVGSRPSFSSGSGPLCCCPVSLRLRVSMHFVRRVSPLV